MQRRKYLAAIGSLAAGGAAAMGTGAFTTGEVPRSATVRVSNDDTDAKLGFSTKVGYGGQSGGQGRSEYANVNGGVLEIDFSGSDSGAESGMNPNGSIYTFDRVFKVLNQGQKKVLVGLDIGNIRDLDAIEEAQVYAGEPYPGDADLDTTLDFSTDPPSINNQVTAALLDPGEDLLVGFRFVTANKSNYSTPFEETPDVSIGGVDVNATST
jgi:hypothetical protein